MKYVILVALVLGSCSCSGDREPAPPQNVTQLTEPTDAIGKELMLALAQAKNFHHKAKVYMSDGNVAAAIASVRQILSLHFPPGAPEAEDVRNDARALLAKLLVGQNQLDEAMTVVSEGLAQSQRESFFVANLYTVKGEIHEARATALESDPASKAKVVEERHAAIDAFERSNKIDETLQKKLSEGK
jgi:hypothetical protein